MVNVKACVCGRDGQDRTAQPLRQPGSKKKLTFPRSSLFLIHQYSTDNQKYKRQNKKADTQVQWHGIEEICGQSNGTDGFAQVREIFGEQVLGIRLNDFHDDFRDGGRWLSIHHCLRPRPEAPGSNRGQRPIILLSK